MAPALCSLRKCDERTQVSVSQIEEDGEIVLELTVAENDLGKVIGKSGRTARALRTLLSAAGIKAQKRYALEILE
ncbi:MAG: RNA-binding protein [Acidobacteria bacterium]|nr:MAG: RNA-binding protein [Acidobacteriota bacterium]